MRQSADQFDMLDLLGDTQPGRVAELIPENVGELFGDLLRDIPNMPTYLSSYLIRTIIGVKTKVDGKKSPCSDIVDDEFFDNFGSALLVHHMHTQDALTKTAFESEIVKVTKACGRNAAFAPKGNPGHDIVIDKVKFSLKTQADESIMDRQLHISKMMELGKGEWTDRPEHFEGLKSQVRDHLEKYERILVLRRLKSRHHHRYELVEIPRELLLEALALPVEISHSSRLAVKPGSIMLRDGHGGTVLKLHFDGGGERKLQIQQLQKCFCIVHGEWVLPRQLA